MRPSFHETRRDTGTDAHVRANPFDSLLGVGNDESVGHFEIEIPPALQQSPVLCPIEPRMGSGHMPTSLFAHCHPTTYEVHEKGAILQRQVCKIVAEV